MEDSGYPKISQSDLKAYKFRIYYVNVVCYISKPNQLLSELIRDALKKEHLSRPAQKEGTAILPPQTCIPRLLNMVTSGLYVAQIP